MLYEYDDVTDTRWTAREGALANSPPQEWRLASDDVAAGALARRRQSETSSWTTAREGAGRYTTFAADC